MSSKSIWWETCLNTHIQNACITIWAKERDEIKNLVNRLIEDRMFQGDTPEIKEKGKNIPKGTYIILFLSDNIKTLQHFLSRRRDLPVVLILTEISNQTLKFLTSPYPLRVVGIFKKKNLLEKNRLDLEDLGNLIRITKQTLRSNISEHQSPDVKQSDFLVKPIEWKISIHEEDDSQPLLTLFLDEPMRNFIHRLQHALYQMKEGYGNIREQGGWEKVLEYLKDPKNILCWLVMEFGSEEEKKAWKDKCKQKEKSGILKRLNQCFRPSKVPRFQPAHILLEGETGTGKSFLRYLMAAFLNIPDERVAYINATTLSKNLLEIQLFGSIKGAFTDAQTKPGVLFTHAFGLVFLDEIGDVDIDVQPKLLQYLEDFQFSPEGLTGYNFFSPTYFVAATNRDLKKLIAEGKFREDLYYRFRSRLRVPALRERKADLKILISYLLQSPHINPRDERKVKFISYRAIQALLEHDFRQGNFRELESILIEAVAQARSENLNVLMEKHIHKALYLVMK